MELLANCFITLYGFKTVAYGGTAVGGIERFL